MYLHAILYIIDIAFLSTSATKVTPCGVFEFHSPQSMNNTFIVKENTSVNITFTLLILNCSNTSFGSIDISQKSLMEDMFGHQCVLYETCKSGPFYNNRSCQCLDVHGLYSFTFIATRQDSTLWKWSTANRMSNDAIIEIVVMYPSLILGLWLSGNDRYISRHKSVSIYCSWENGYPPSEVRLLDRHSKTLKSGNNSGYISYTYHSVDCDHAGTIRCEANGSYKNVSHIMLVECPPHIPIALPKILTIYSEQNVNITFPFRSHESYITNCHITRLNQNTNMETVPTQGTISFTCTNLSMHVTLERKYCIYALTGIPPDLQLNLQVYNTKREDVGLWCVNVSNNIGSDVMYIQLENNHEENHLSSPGNMKTDPVYTADGDKQTYIVLHPLAIIGTVIGIIMFTVIVLIIAYFIKNGKDLYSKLRKREMNEMIVYRGLGAQFTNSVDQSQEQYEIYNEIADTTEHEDLQSSPEQNPVELCVSHFADSPRHIHWETTSNDNSNTGYIRRVKSKIITSPVLVRYSKFLANFEESNQSNTYNHLQAIQTEKGTCNEPEMPNVLHHIQIGKEEENKTAMPIDLKHNEAQPKASDEPEMPTDVKHETRQNASNEPAIPTDLKHNETQSEASNESEMTNDPKRNETQKETYNKPVIPNDLKHTQTGSEKCHVAELSDDLKRIETGSTPCSVSHDLEIVNSIQTSNENVNRQDTSNYLTLISTFNETCDVADNSDYLEPIQTG